MGSVESRRRTSGGAASRRFAVGPRSTAPAATQASLFALGSARCAASPRRIALLLWIRSSRRSRSSLILSPPSRSALPAARHRLAASPCSCGFAPPGGAARRSFLVHLHTRLRDELPETEHSQQHDADAKAEKDEDRGHRRAVGKVEVALVVRERGVKCPQAPGLGGIETRAAVRREIDVLVRGEEAHRLVDEDEEDRPLDERERDPPNDLERRRPVHLRRAEEILRDGADRAGEDEHPEGRADEAVYEDHDEPWVRLHPEARLQAERRDDVVQHPERR